MSKFIESSNLQKPIAVRISQWGSGRELIYTCPVCGANFGILGTTEKYCHNCSCGIDWNVCVHVNEYISSLYHEGEDYLAVIKAVNKINAGVQDNKPFDFVEFDEAAEVKFRKMVEELKGARTKEEK